MWKSETSQPKASETPNPPLVVQPKATVVARIGTSVFIKGNITSSEDLAIDGRVEGTIDVGAQRLTIGPGAEVSGDVSAGAMSISGAIKGSVIASERIEIKETGSVNGDIAAPKLAVRDGAVVYGRIDVGAPRPQILQIAV
jgi:cytoskeletal protein CcmA (bactofilin family)